MPPRAFLPLLLTAYLAGGAAHARPPDPTLAALRDAHPIAVRLDDERDRDGWFNKARALADRTALADHYRSVGYTPPAHSRVLTVAVRPGVGQPRYFHYSLGDTGFVTPRRSFHPASTVKLAAAVGALRTVGTLGLTGDVQLEFNDGEARYRGTLAAVIRAALLRSSNPDYNRLVRIAGFDELNEDTLSPRWGLPAMAVQARYGTRAGPTLRRSPAIRWREGPRAGRLPARVGTSRHPDCPGNCASLFELHDVQRRVLLHDELPADQRFPISARDVDRMRATLRAARKRLGTAPAAAFGAPVEVFNNVGRIPGTALIENATIVEPASGRRVFIVAAVAFPPALGRSDAQVVPRLQALVRPSLDLTLARAPDGPGLQHDAGPRPRLAVACNAAGGLLVEVTAPAEARVWLDRTPLARRGPAAFVGADVTPGEHVVVVELGPADAPTGYRASLVTLPGPTDARRDRCAPRGSRVAGSGCDDP
mgnify:CR=1 FL=1